MNTQEIFNRNDHRPLPMPRGSWIVYQEWHQVLFQVQNLISIKTESDKWLTERYALVQDKSQNTIFEYEIHHYEWPLHEVHLQINSIKYNRFNRVLPKAPEYMHFSPGVEILTWKRKNRTV